jgi:hypothetical protein
MAKFIIHHTMAAWVTWSYIIEADDEEAAMEKYREDQPRHDSVEIGDCLDWAEDTMEIETREG